MQDPLPPFVESFHSVRSANFMVQHIHEMLIDRAEAAAKRIMALDDYVSTLYVDSP